MQDRVVGIDPDAQSVSIASGAEVGYDFLVVAPGIHLDWDGVAGLGESLGRSGVTSNYRGDLAPLTWELVRKLRGGTAIFTAPSTLFKCGGAPQKAAYLAADWWRREGVLRDTRIVLVIPGTGIFGVPEFRRVLEGVIERYGIEVWLEHELVEVDGDHREAVIVDHASAEKQRVPFDLLHVVPPQRAPDVVRESRLAEPGDAFGGVEADRYTLQHPRYPNVFSLGDASGVPAAKTGAAVRKQAPVLVENLLAVASGHRPAARYDGYSSCPFITARDRVLLAEFDYSLRPHKTVPLVDTAKERYDMFLLKRYGLPLLYWNLMLKGLA